MTGEEQKEIQQVFGALAPMLRQTIQMGVLAALRQHSEEQAVTVQMDTNIDYNDLLRKDIAKTVEHLQPKAEPTAQEFVDITGEFDAAKWADLFVRTNPPTDIDTMRSWFANAIMAGYDHAKKEVPTKKMGEMLSIQGSSGNWNCDPYMHGMYNGMEYMLAMVENRDPNFRDAPAKWLNDVKTPKSTTATPYEEEQDRLRNCVSHVSPQDVWAQVYSRVFSRTAHTASPEYASRVAIKAANEAVQQLEKWLEK